MKQSDHTSQDFGREPFQKVFTKVRRRNQSGSGETCWCRDPVIAKRHCLEIPFLAHDIIDRGGGLTSISFRSLHEDYEDEGGIVSEFTLTSMLSPHSPEAGGTEAGLSSKAPSNGAHVSAEHRQHLT